MAGQAYSATVLEHFARPRNLGRLPGASGQGVAGDLRDGPVQITIAVRVERDETGEERVTAARFRAFGCSAAIASSSMATVLIEGQPLRVVAALTPGAILAALGGLPEDRLYAPALAAEAVQKAIADCGLRIADEGTPEGMAIPDPSRHSEI
jgi:nitrogen fixation NifU-like protein